MLDVAASVSGQRARALPPLILLVLWTAAACAQGSDASEGAPGGSGGGASNGGASGGGDAGCAGGSTAGTLGSSTGGAVGVYTGGASTGGASTGGASTGGASTGGATGAAGASGAGASGGSGNAGASGVGGSSGTSGAGGVGGSSGAVGAGGSSGACAADAETSDIEVCPGLPLAFTGAPLAVTVTGATNGRSDDYSDCSGAGKESVYRFIAPQAGTVRATLTPSGIRATLYARASACQSGGLIICENPGSIGAAATATFDVTQCGKYYVFADQDIGVLNGSYELELRYE